jgi:hypothetical protein
MLHKSVNRLRLLNDPVDRLIDRSNNEIYRIIKLKIINFRLELNG